MKKFRQSIITIGLNQAIFIIFYPHGHKVDKSTERLLRKREAIATSGDIDKKSLKYAFSGENSSGKEESSWVKKPKKQRQKS